MYTLWKEIYNINKIMEGNMNKKLFGIVFAICLMISGGIFSQNVSASEKSKNVMEAHLEGTLSKPGDSVPISISKAYETKFVKFVSSTDKTLIVYTDSHEIKPNLIVYDKDGNFVKGYSNNIDDSMDTGSEYNIGLIVKVKKGATYYFECSMYDEVTDDYNIKLAYPKNGYDYSCGVSLLRYNEESGYGTNQTLGIDNYKDIGLSYDRKSRTLTLDNYKGNDGFYIHAYPDILTDEVFLEIKVVGENVIKGAFVRSGVMDINVPVKFTGNGTLTFDDYEYKDASAEPKTYDNGIRSVYDVTIDGPVINFNLDYVATPITIYGKLTIQNGKININDGKGMNYMDIYADDVVVNGGEINISSKAFCGKISTGRFVMNGGAINALVKCTEDTNTPNKNCYRVVIFANEELTINDGKILIKYEDTKIDKDKIDFESPFLIRESANINGGSIYIIIPEGLKDLFPKDIVGVYNPNNNPDIKPIIKISKNAKIITGSSEAEILEKIKKEEAAGKSANVSRFTYKNLKYKVLKTGTKDGKNVGEVSVVGVNKKTLKKINIGAFVTNDGVKYKVVSIGKKAFSKLKNLKKVTIGKNVRSIGANAFYGDKKLSKIVIKAKVIKKVGKNAIKKTSKKLVITVPKKQKKAYKKLFKKAGNKKVKVK